MNFSVIGPGRVGAALAKRLSDGGWKLIGLAAGSLDSASRAADWIGAGRAFETPSDAVRGADVVFLTVPDRCIEPVCTAVAEAHAFEKGASVIHTSGAMPAEILSAARSLCECRVASMHPLQSFASPESALRLFPASFFAVEGDEQAVEVARNVVTLLAGRFVQIRSSAKTLYHAGACVASNYLVALADVAVELLQEAGIPRDTALEMLLPLVQGTVSNLRQIGLPHALTGPVARGDRDTVEQHLEAIGRSAPEVLDIYRIMHERAARIAEEMKSKRQVEQGEQQ